VHPKQDSEAPWLKFSGPDRSLLVLVLLLLHAGDIKLMWNASVSRWDCAPICNEGVGDKGKSNSWQRV
jgi:hypothetical protein